MMHHFAVVSESILFRTILCTGVLTGLMLSCAKAQQTIGAPVPAFEVVAAHADKEDRDLAIQFTADGVHATGVTLDTLLRLAYGLDDGQIEREPKWGKQTKFSVDSKVAPEDAAAWQRLSPEQSRIAVQNLLAQAFHVRAHLEPSLGRVQDLVVVHDSAGRLEKHRTSSSHPRASSMDSSPGHIDFSNASLESLCTALSNQLGRKVVDKTGVVGSFDFDLHFAPVRPDTDGMDTGENALPSLFDVLKRDFGLQLVAAKDSVPMLVIDAAEEPRM